MYLENKQLNQKAAQSDKNPKNIAKTRLEWSQE